VTNEVSIVALNFSAALDNLFNLGASGELAMNVEQKYGPKNLLENSVLTRRAGKMKSNHANNSSKPSMLGCVKQMNS